jgi:Icc-related predicted phosphoesterase
METGLSIKVCCISDLHGHLIDNIEPCDLVLICGDSVALSHQAGWHKAKNWYRHKFKPWAEVLPCDKVFFIGGNHDPIDSYTEQMHELFPINSRVSYLCNECAEFTKYGRTIKLFGSPYCKIFGNWYFMKDDKSLEKYYSEIPKRLDILFTHDTPYKISDILLQKEVSFVTDEHIGNKPLREAIIRTMPTYHVSGHLHSCDHTLINYGFTRHANVSILDELYKPVYEPLYINL